LTAVVHIEQGDLRAGEAGLRACYEIFSAAQELDEPDRPPRSLTTFRHWWTVGHDSMPRQVWLGTDTEGRPAGCYLLMLPDRENADLAMAILVVPPQRRRAGFGAELLAHCIAQARLAGRARLSGEARDDSPGAAFARAAGATGGIGDVFRRLVIDEALAGRLPALRTAAAARSAGYSLLHWTGATPADALPGLAALSGTFADAPRDEGVEPPSWDADRVASFEAFAVDAGLHLYSVAARHEESGRLAAITQLSADPQVPGWAFQSLTAVLRPDRGHALGLRVKVAMLDLLAEQEPGLRQIVTGNADGNEHMIAINDQLGFEITSVDRAWTLALA
jgi:RimJ/RimL family protein N-acetyltransferase